MFPVLLSIGPLSLRTFFVFLVIAIVIGSFLFWRKSREEHYPEQEALDMFIKSLLIGILAGRVGFVAMNLSTLGFSFINWINIFQYPGLHGWVTLVASTIVLITFARKQKWDVFETLDFWVIAMSAATAFIYIGLFFDGSVFGNETQLPIGLQFPGVYTKHHPTQLYWALAFCVLSWYLSKLEYRYRTFEWYRGGRSTAQTGFLVSVFLILSNLFGFIISFFQPPLLVPIALGERLIYMAGFIFGFVLLWLRSGKSHAFLNRNK